MKDGAIERSAVDRSRGGQWARQPLSGWGSFPVQECLTARPESLAATRSAVSDGGVASVIARGLGRSYGDSAVNAGGGVLLQRDFSHFLGFSQETGEVTCEGGVSLAQIVACMLPRGWFLPVTPGTKFVTVGGAIAADVHGKNHHVDGSFGRYVKELDLLTASGEVLTCSPEQNAEIFWATVGGMGLTGVILRATIRLLKVPSAYARVQYRKARSLDKALELCAATESSARYSVAWIDCVARGRKMGRAVLMLGDHAAPDEVRTGNPLALPRKRQKNVPFFLPSIALNRFSVKLFNMTYYGKAREGQRLVDFETFFYPLDGVLNWNRIYGRRGFVQYQALLPRDQAKVGMHKLLGKISASGQSSFLAVLKSSGAAGSGPMSFMYPGFTLALDLPNTGPGLIALAKDLDRILLDHGGRLYMAKDSLTDADTFRRMYPRFEEFLAVKTRIDPSCRFDSSQARRLGLSHRQAP